jgi:hypothetical protein
MKPLSPLRSLFFSAWFVAAFAFAHLAAAAPFAFSNTGSLVTARYGHTATLLQNGKVFVAGGNGGATVNDVLATAELYDPAIGVWTATGSLAQVRRNHTATMLPNGKVLAAGGSTTSGAQSLSRAARNTPSSGGGPAPQ